MFAVVDLSTTAPYLTEEWQGRSTLIVSRSGNTTDALTVGISLGGSATNGIDYVDEQTNSAVANAITIPAGASSAAISLIPIDDFDIEGDEEVLVELAEPSQGLYTIGSGSVALPLYGNDISLSADRESFSESYSAGTFANFFVYRDSIHGSLSLNYYFHGSANYGSDYQALPMGFGSTYNFGFLGNLSGTLVFEDGYSYATVSVFAVDDGQVEDVESVELQLSHHSGAEASSAVALYSDDTINAGSIYLGSGGSWMQEGNSSNSTATFYFYRYSSNGSLPVAYQLAGSATFGSDYTAQASGFGSLGAVWLNGSSGTITFEDGYNYASITVFSVDDEDIENLEEIDLQLTPYGNSQVSSSVVLYDNDPVSTGSLSIWSDRYSIQEGSPSYSTVIFTIYRNSSFGSLPFSYLLSGSATFGSDYTAQASGFGSLGSTWLPGSSGTIVFEEGYSYATISVEAIDDLDVEDVEKLDLELVPYTGNSVSSSVYIYSNDTLPTQSVYLSANPMWVEEGNGSASVAYFTVFRDSAVGSLNVSYSFSGSGVFGSDFTAQALGFGSQGAYWLDSNIGNLTFEDGYSQATISVFAIDDVEIESAEEIDLQISSSFGNTANGSVTIYDNDFSTGSIAMWADRTWIQEGSYSTVNITIYRDSTYGSLSFDYSLSGLANFGSDYSAQGSGFGSGGLFWLTSSYGTITFEDGYSYATITLTANDDYECEMLEDVTLSIQPLGGLSSWTTIEVYDATDSSFSVWVSVDHSTIYESGPESQATFTIYRDNATGSGYFTYGLYGNASYSSDYGTATPYGEIFFDYGVYSASVTITAYDDYEVEGSEEVGLYAYPTQTGNSSYGTVVIEDNDYSSSSSIALWSDTNYFTENYYSQSALYMTVHRDTAYGSMSINYNFTGTAMFGSDFTATADGFNYGGSFPLTDSTGTLIFEDGFSYATITLYSVDDSEFEETEDITLQLVADNGAASSLTVNLLDYTPLPEIDVREYGNYSLPSGSSFLSFGTTYVNVPTTKVLEIVNTGNLPLVFGETPYTVPDGITLDGTPPAQLLPGESWYASLTMDSNVERVITGTISFFTNDSDESVYTIDLGGEVIEYPPEIEISLLPATTLPSGSTLNFGDTETGSPVVLTLQIANTGAGPLWIDAGEISIPAGFHLLSSIPGSIPAESSVSVEIQFDALTIGCFGGSLIIPNNDADEGDYEILLDAQAVGSLAEIAVEESGVNRVSGQSTLHYGVTQQGAPLTRSFTISNMGTVPLELELSNLTIPTGYAITQAPAANLAPGTTSTLTVALTAQNPGTYSGWISIPSNDSDENPFLIPISGEVEQLVGNIEVRNGSALVPANGYVLNFGATTLETPIGKTLTITNTGNAPLTIDVEGITASVDFEVTQLPSATLAAGASTTLLIQLTAATVGPVSGSLSIPNNDPDANPFVITLSGEVFESLPELDVFDGATTITDGVSTIDFGVAYTTAYVTKTLTIHNSGNGPLHLSTASLQLPSGITAASLFAETVAAGADTTLVLQMQSTSARTISGTVSFTSDDPNESPFTFSITGVVKSGVAEAYITDVHLTVDNGVSTAERVTNDPRVDFVVNGAFAGNARLEFDHDNDGIVDGDLTLLVPGETVVYDPRETDASFLNLTGEVHLRYRIVFTAQAGNDSISPWETFSYNLVAGSPEIDITDASDSSIPDNTGLLEFGSTLEGTSVSQLLTIHNTGDGILTLDLEAATLPTGFVWGTLPPTQIAPGDTATLEVVLEGATAGIYHGDLVIPTNDADENPYDFELFGEVIALAPEVELRVSGGRRLFLQDVVDFGATEVGMPLVHSFVIENLGNEDLHLIDPATLTWPAGLDLSNPWPTTLEPGTSVTFQVHLTATTAATFDHVLAISTDDADEALFEIALRGEILPSGQTPPVDITSIGVFLVNDTGDNSDDWVTYDANLAGVLTTPAPWLGQIVVDFDHDQDGIPEGHAIVNQSDGSFSYDPRQVDPAWRNQSGPLPLRYRWRFTDGDGITIAFASSWTAQTIQLETPPWVDDLQVDDIGLTNNLATNGTWTSTNPTVFAHVAGDLVTPYFALQFDHDGDGIVDGEIQASAGNEELVYDPRSVDPTWENTTASRILAYRLQTRDADGNPLDTGAWQTFSFEQSPLAASQLTATLNLVADQYVNGVPASTNPVLTGQVNGTQSVVSGSQINSAITVEIDLDGDLETIEGTIAADTLYHYEFAPSLATYGEKTVQVRVKEWSPLHGADLYGPWSDPFDFRYLAPLSPIVESLTYDTSGDVPVLTGGLAGDRPYVTVEFDYDGDNVIDGYTLTDDSGNFSHSPRGLTPGASYVVRARSSIFDSKAEAFVPGAWFSVYITVPLKPVATISSLGLVEDTGTSDTDKITTNSALTGVVVDNANPTRSLGGLTIEYIQNNGTGISGYATTDASGQFNIQPAGLVPNVDAVQLISARVVEWDAVNAAYVHGDWLSFTFRLEPQTFIPAQIVGLGQVRVSTLADGVHSDPALQGQVISSSNSYSVPYGIVQYRIDGATDEQGNAVIAGEVTADAEGIFQILPTGLEMGAHTISVRTKEWNYGTRSGGYGSWIDHAITLANDTNDPAALTSLSIQPPTYGSWYNNATTQGDSSFSPVVSGTVTNTQGFAHVLVEFADSDSGPAVGIAQVDSDGTFSYRPAGVTFGSLTLYARTLEWDSLTSQYLVSTWEGPYSYNFQPPAANSVDTYGLTAIRRPDGSLLLEGGVYGDYAAGQVVVSYRYENTNGVIEAQTGAVDGDGKFHLVFTNPQAGVDWLYEQTTFVNPATGVLTQSNWEYHPPVAITSATSSTLVTGLHLVTDNGLLTDDRISSVGDIAGQVIGDNVAGITVYVSRNTTSGVETVTTDSQGNFVWYQHSNVPRGQQTVSFTSYVGGFGYDASNTAIFKYTLESPNVIDAVVDQLLVADGVGGISASGLVTGHVSGTNGEPVAIEYRFGSQYYAGGTTTTASDGTFTLDFGSEADGTYIPLRVRVVPAFNEYSYQVAEEGWTALNFYKHSDPNSLEAQALRLVMGRFDTDWQTAANQTAPVNPLLANALQRLGNGVYDYEQLQVQADRERELARAQAEATYNAAKASAEATRGAALATAATDFATALASFSGDTTTLPMRDFVWPDAPQNVSYVLPNDSDQPTAPTGPDYSGPAYSFEQDSGYQEAVASATQVYNQAVKQAEDAYDAAERQALDLFGIAKKQADQQLATALSEADAAYQSATSSAGNPYSLDAAGAKLAEAKSKAKSAWDRAWARLTEDKTREDTRLSNIRLAEVEAADDDQLAIEEANYRENVGKAKALLTYNKACAEANAKLETANHAAEATYEKEVARHDHYARNREINAATIRDTAKSDARKTHAQSIATAAAIRDRSLVAAAETLANAVAQADATQWQQKAAAAKTAVTAWDNFIDTSWSEYQKTLVTDEYDYVVGLIPSLLTQATSDDSTAKSAAMEIIDQRETLEKAAADLINVREKADLTDLATYRSSANDQQRDREIRDDDSWKTYQDQKSENTRVRSIEIAKIKELVDLPHEELFNEQLWTYHTAYANRTFGANGPSKFGAQAYLDRRRLTINPLSVGDDPETPQIESGFTSEFYAIRQSMINAAANVKEAYDNKHVADLKYIKDNSKARKEYEQSVTGSEQTYHEKAIPAYQEFLDKVAGHAETLAKDYAEKYVAYVKALSAKDKSSAAELTDHSKTANDAELQLSATQSIADTAALGTFQTEVVDDYLERVAAWAQEHQTPWGTFQSELAQLEADGITQTAAATTDHVSAVAPMAASAGAEESGHEKTLADDVSTKLDDETKTLADSLKDYALEVAAKRKAYAVGLNDAVATHDLDVVKANVKYQKARSVALETLTNEIGTAKKTREDAITVYRTSYWINLDESESTPVAKMLQDAELNTISDQSANDAELERQNDFVEVEHEWIDAFDDATNTAQSTWVSSLATAYVTWVEELGDAHAALAEAGKEEADALASSLKSASDQLSESEADAAQTMLDGLAQAENSYTKDEAQTAKNLADSAGAADDDYSDQLGSIGDAQRAGATAARGEYTVSEFTNHQTRLSNTAAPAGASSAWDTYQRETAAADTAQATREAEARNTFEETINEHNQQQRSGDSSGGGSDAGLQLTNDLADNDKQFSDSLSQAEADIEKTTATAASQAAKTGVIAETKLDLDQALAQKAYDNSVAAAEALLWTTLQQAFVTHFEANRAAERMTDPQQREQAGYQAGVDYDEAKTNAQNAYNSSVQQAKADYALAIGNGKVARAATQGAALETYSAAVDGAESSYVGAFNSAEDSHVSGEQAAESAYIEATNEEGAANSAADRARAYADSQAYGDAQLALITSLANSAAQAATDKAQAEANLRTSQAAQHTAIVDAKLLEYQNNTITLSLTERWLLAFDQAEADWEAAVAPAFVAYATAMANAAATETIAQATAANAQSLADLQADQSYESSTEGYFGQAQEDQLDAWYDYLGNWYEPVHNYNVAVAAAQSAFDATVSAAETARSIAYAEGDRDAAYNAAFNGTSSDALNYLARTAADIVFAAAWGQADIDWSTAIADAEQDNDWDEGDAQRDYEIALADIDLSLAQSLAPHEVTRQAAYASAQTAYWTDEVNAANTRRLAEYQAIANFRSTDYQQRAGAIADLAVDFDLPFVEFQADLAAARSTWWGSFSSGAGAANNFIAVATAKNAADSTYQSAVNTAYTQWSSTVAQAGSTYSLDQAQADHDERVANANSQNGYVHEQSVAKRDFYVNYANTRSGEFLRVTTELHDSVAAGNSIANYAPFEPVWTDGWSSPYNQDLLTPHNADYTQRVIPADSKRRMDLFGNSFAKVNDSYSAEQAYHDAVAAAEETYVGAEGVANITREGSYAIADGQYDAQTTADWATLASNTQVIASSPWSELAAAQAQADADYAAALITPVAPAVVGPLVEYHTALAQAELDYAMALSRAHAANGQYTLGIQWRDDMLATRQSFFDDTYITPFDNYFDALNRLSGAVHYNLAAVPSGDTPNSFTPDTLVLMADGSTKPIGQIEIGDLVQAEDPVTGERGPRAVIDIITGTGTKEMVDITIAGGVLSATTGHPFWVINRNRWVEAGELEVGDQLQTDDGDVVMVEALQQYTLDYTTVKNLTVDGLHTYFVVSGAEAVLVHNQGPGQTKKAQAAENSKSLPQPKTPQATAPNVFPILSGPSLESAQSPISKECFATGDGHTVCQPQDDLRKSGDQLTPPEPPLPNRLPAEHDGGSGRELTLKSPNSPPPIGVGVQVTGGKMPTAAPLVADPPKTAAPKAEGPVRPPKYNSRGRPIGPSPSSPGSARRTAESGDSITSPQKTRYSIAEIERLVDEGIAFHPGTRDRDWAGVESDSTHERSDLVIFTDVAGDGYLTLIFEKDYVRKNSRDSNPSVFYKIAAAYKQPFAAGATLEQIEATLSVLRNQQRADRYGQFFDDQAWIDYFNNADAALTTVLHLVPFGEAADAFSQGNYTQMLIALAGDAATFIGGPLAKFADGIHDAVALGKAGANLSKLAKVVPCSGKLKVFAFGLELAGAGLKASEGVKILLNEGAAGLPSASLMFGDALLDVLGVTMDAKNIKRWCFPAGTLVHTEEGQRPIEQVQPTERVWACNLKTGQWELAPVLITYETEYEGEMLDLSYGYDGETLSTTPRHPFWVVAGEGLADRPIPEHERPFYPDAAFDGRWVNAIDLSPNDLLKLKDGRVVTLHQIARRQFKGLVYNYRVAELHTYAVGATGVLVHNSNCGGAGDVPKSLPKLKGEDLGDWQKLVRNKKITEPELREMFDSESVNELMRRIEKKVTDVHDARPKIIDSISKSTDRYNQAVADLADGKITQNQFDKIKEQYDSISDAQREYFNRKLSE